MAAGEHYWHLAHNEIFLFALHPMNGHLRSRSERRLNWQQCKNRSSAVSFPVFRREFCRRCGQRAWSHAAAAAGCAAENHCTRLSFDMCYRHMSKFDWLWGGVFFEPIPCSGCEQVVLRWCVGGRHGVEPHHAMAMRYAARAARGR